VIHCNEIEVEQVIVNLINNALDAIKTKIDKWIKISIYEEANQVVLRVMDSGKGIPEEVRQNLFDPFFTTKQTGEGTGLGLSISKGIIDEHKATITVLDNCPNTCFEIRFPQIKEGFDAY
jgi:C4-dicarboxylate-specific signal transduction histidine kinase